jgi:hypothetical protein
MPTFNRRATYRYSGYFYFSGTISADRVLPPVT